MYNMDQDVSRVLVSSEELAEICDRLAAQITEEYANDT